MGDEKEVESARGTKQDSPSYKILRDGVLSKLVESFELFGFSPLDTPILQKYDVLAAKFASGEGTDVQKEIYKLVDQGGRRLGLRFDLTVPLAVFIAENPNIKLPFKRYEIGRVFRDGPLKLGRYREFEQCDADIIGANPPIAELELLELALDFFDKTGLKLKIEINGRRVLDGILDLVEVKEEIRGKVIIILDKLKKIGEGEVKKELNNLGLENKQVNKLLELLNLKGTNKERIKKLNGLIRDERAKKELGQIEKIISLLPLQKNIEFNSSLARGLNYYTGIIFEGFLLSSDITSSVCAGGRYDEMVGGFASQNKEYPAVGISFGLEPIIDAIRIRNEKKNILLKQTKTKVLVLPIGKTLKKSLNIIRFLRKNKIASEISLIEKGISKVLDYANSKGIPFVLFVGEREVKAKKFKLKNMKSGREEMVSNKGILDRIKKN